MSEPIPADLESSPDTKSAPLPARRRVPWRRVVVLLVLLVVGYRWWMSWRSERETSRQQAVAADLERLGGVTRFWHGEAVQVTFTGVEVRRETLVSLGALPQLRRLVLIDVRLPADALDGIAERLPALREFVLMQGELSEQALQQLGQCRQLTQLQLHRTGITDQGLVHLRELVALTRLDLQDEPISDEGLVHLKELAALEQVHLNGTRVTPAGIQNLQLALPLTNIRS